MQRKIDTRGTRWVSGQVPNISKLPTVSLVASGDFIIVLDASGNVIGKYDATKVGWKMGDNVLIVEQNGSGDYTTITSALSAATSGQTVLFMPGTYDESVTVSAGISLEGLSRDTCIIEYTGANDTAVTLDGANARIANCTVKHAKTSGTTAKAVGIASGTGTVYFENVTMAQVGPSVTNGFGVMCARDGNAGKNCTFSADATNAYAAWFDSAATIIGGSFTGDVVSTDSEVELIGVPLITGTITEATGGTVVGPFKNGADELELYGEEIVLDEDGDTSISAPTDDQVDFEVGGTDEAILVPGGWGSDTFAIKVKNSSGGTVATGDVGYIDTSGEYQETTTAYNFVSWCVVLIGGSDGSDIYVAKRGTVLVTLNGNCSIGDFLYTSTTAGQAQPQSYTRMEMFAVATTANSSGAGGTCEAVLLISRDYWSITGSTEMITYATIARSQWTSTINGAPSGTSVVYSGSGTWQAENAIYNFGGAAELIKQVLHNTTRGDSALIASVNTGTNTITLTDTVPGTWADTDTITANSQTNTSAPWTSTYFFDYDCSQTTEIPLTTTSVWIQLQNWKTTTTDQGMMFHPYEANNGAKRIQIKNIFVTGTGGNNPVLAVDLIQRQFCMAHQSNGVANASLRLRLKGCTVAVP